MEKNVPDDWDKYRKGIIDPGFLIIGAEIKRESFRNNMEDQKTENFDINCCNTKPMCFCLRP